VATEAEEQEFTRVKEEARRLGNAVTNREESIITVGPRLLACLRRMVEIAPSNAANLADQWTWALEFSLHEWAAHDDGLHDWDDFESGLDQLIAEYS
jgi:hypothetical protein